MIPQLLRKIAERLRKRLGVAPRDPSEVNEVHWIASMFDDAVDGVMVDVGAHFGESLAVFSEKGWQVVAFEPDKSGGKHDAIRSQLNARSQLLWCALSNAEEPARPFFTSGVSTGISGLLPFHASHEAAGSVEVRTLRGVLRDLGVDRVDFLKIDTEGNDLMVLQGLGWAVRPSVILCEFEDAKTRLAGYGFADLAGHLQDGGYEVFVSEWYPIERYGAQHSWRSLRRYPCRLRHARAWGNFIAVRPEGTERFLSACRSMNVRLKR